MAPAPRGAAPRALALAKRVQRLSPARGCAALIEAQPFTLIAQRGTRGAGELFDPLPRCCLSVQPLALEGWITRPSLFPVNYSRYRGSSCKIDRNPPKGTRWLTKQTARSRLPSPSPIAPTPRRARGHPVCLCGMGTRAGTSWLSGDWVLIPQTTGPKPITGNCTATIRRCGLQPQPCRPSTSQYNPVKPSKTL